MHWAPTYCLASLLPLQVLDMGQKLQFVKSVAAAKLGFTSVPPFKPSFSRCVDHFLIHAGTLGLGLPGQLPRCPARRSTIKPWLFPTVSHC